MYMHFCFAGAYPILGNTGKETERSPIYALVDPWEGGGALTKYTPPLRSNPVTLPP